MRPTTVVHSGSNVVSHSFPHDRQSVNISYCMSDHNIFPGIWAIQSYGYQYFLPFLKEVTRETFIGYYKGKTAAVDASCWLHKALAISVQRTGQSERYVLATEYRLFHQLNHLERFLTLFVCTVGFLIV